MRAATADDAPQLLPLYDSFYGPYFRPKSVEAIRARLIAVSAIDTVLVAEVGGDLAGFASLRLLPQIESDRLHAELSDIYVREERRRRGIGRALLRSAENLARSSGCARIFLVTGLDNDGARAFYRALGYRDHAVQMGKDLGASP